MEDRFGFGANWVSYLDRHFSEERAEIARRRLLESCGLPDLKGLTFIDIGSGSGLHSLGAWRSGAESVLSFDYDPLSVAATRSMRAHVGDPANWDVRQGSILDGELCQGLGTFDVVYSWGVLHHTGDLWTAISNAVSLMGPRSRLCLALYSSDEFISPPPEYWLDVKRRYNRAGWLRKRWMEAQYVWTTICGRRLGEVLRLPAAARAYKADRGMALMTDVRDWLGGWPMEFSSIREVVDTLGGWGLKPVTIKTGAANTEYLFVHEAAMEELGCRPLSDAQCRTLWGCRILDVSALADLDQVYVFGTGRGARLLHQAFQRANGPAIAGFIDLESEGSLEGLPVHRFEDFVTRFANTVPVVLSTQHVAQNTARLLERGFENILNAHPLVVRLFQDNR